MSHTVGEVYDIRGTYRSIRDILHGLSQLQINAEELLTYCFEECLFGVVLEAALDDLYARLQLPWEQELLETALEQGRAEVTHLTQCIPALQRRDFSGISVTAVGYLILERKT